MKHPIISSTATLLCACLVLPVSCNLFPTKQDDDEGNPTDLSDEIINNDEPDILPQDIDENADTSPEGIDSMFNLLLRRIESLENVDHYNDFFAIEFESLRKGFGAAVNDHHSNIKANVGFVGASILSLNASSSIHKLADSIDAYSQAVDEYYYTEDPYLSKKVSGKSAKRSFAPSMLSKTYKSSGILGLGKSLLAESPKVLLAQTQRPSFPRFVTASYIQKIISSEVIPRLNEVLASVSRLENLSSMSLVVDMFEESTEIDKGDIYVFESSVRLARAMLSMFCIYDLDLYSPDGSSDMRWIDDVVEAANTQNDYYSTKKFTISNDTLYETSIYDMSPSACAMADVYAYNLNREEYLKIKKNYFNAVYADLKAVPIAVENALKSMRSETDGQDDDLIMRTRLLDNDAEMADFQSDLINEGFSEDFAGNFSSPEALCGFITKLLTESYEFSETIEGVTYTLKVDLSKFFTNPPKDLKKWLPKHKVTSGEDRLQSTTNQWHTSYSSYEETTIYYYSYYGDTVIIDIPESRIDSIIENTSSTSYIYLTQGYTSRVYVDSIISCVALKLLDDDGNEIDYEEIGTIEDDASQLEAGFPYFEDYTFGGIFPDMNSRRQWVDFFKKFF
jgi:hypothetical protein